MWFLFYYRRYRHLIQVFTALTDTKVSSSHYILPFFFFACIDTATLPSKKTGPPYTAESARGQRLKNHENYFVHRIVKNDFRKKPNTSLERSWSRENFYVFFIFFPTIFSQCVTVFSGHSGNAFIGVISSNSLKYYFVDVARKNYDTKNLNTPLKRSCSVDHF